LFFVSNIHGWDFENYIDLNADPKWVKEKDVTDVTFRLYSTKYVSGDDTHKKIMFDEETGEATLKDEGFFDSSIPTKVIVHGRGGGLLLDNILWKNYAEVADEVGKHYNIIGVRWGKGSFGRVAWTGIKTAKVVKSFVEKYGLKVPDIHGIGFSFGSHVVNGMATELNDMGFGKVDRLTLLDPGRIMPKFRIDGEKQWGLVNKKFAEFMDVFHTSEGYGIWQKSVGDVDVWMNGGLTQPPNLNHHKAAVHFYSRTILMTSEDCTYVAWECTDHKWTPYKWKKRNKPKSDTCEFGNTETENAMQSVGEYIDRGEQDLTTGNFIVFTNGKYGYCEDGLDCKVTC